MRTTGEAEVWSVGICHSSIQGPESNQSREGYDGHSDRVFVQEELFGPEEYRQVVAYHYRMARHHLFKAQTYREHAKMRYGLQLSLFCEEDSEIGDEPWTP